MILRLINILKSYATLNHIIMEANRFNFCAEFVKNWQKLAKIGKNCWPIIDQTKQIRFIVKRKFFMVFEKNLSFKKIDLEIPITSFQKIEWFHYGCTLFSCALVLHTSYLTATIQLTIINRLGTRLAYALS